MAVNKPASIAFVCEGDAEGDAFSGTARSMVSHLRALGHEVRPVNVRPPVPLRLGNAALSFSPDRARWRARFRYGDPAFHVRSLMAHLGLARLGRRVDVVLQIGATFAPPQGVPYALYADWNMALSSRFRDNAQAATTGLTPSEERQINERQRAVYRGARAIFTISERLRQSFIEDYAIAPDRVVCAYPGANVSPEAQKGREGARPAGRPPTILFVGFEFARKGGDVLVRALGLVRRRLPDARLVIIGPTDLQIDEPGVEVVGRLRNDVPEEAARLARAFLEADVFCLPSRLDPFPNVVREAMFYGLPCVTSDVFAFPEMVRDGETGFTVPVGDVEALADRLLRVLGDEALARRLGEAGRARAAEIFTWTSMARILSGELERVRRE